ncbi:MAG: tetratricopeptide repeat protein [Thermodesulfobacteriota bacterium]|nr:tetratricopeptide repeat protein [Thermodesulfobacteriota bacterium]
MVYLRTLLCLGLPLLLLLSAAPVQADEIPISVRRVVLQAQSLMDKQHYAEALAVLEKQRQRPQHHYLIDFTIGNIYLLSQRKSKAITWYRAVLAGRPDHSGAWLNLAQCYYAGEHYIKAAKAFEQGYRYRQPAQAQLLYNAALAYLQAQQPNEALAALLQLLADFPDAIQNSWRAALVQVYVQLDQPRHTLVHLEILAQQTEAEDQRRWRELLVQQYLVLKMTDKALAMVQFLTRVDGLEARWWTLLTHLHLEAGRYAQGLVTLKVVAYLQPLNKEELRLLADLHLTLGVPQQAIHYYTQLRQQHPHDNRLLTRLVHASLNLHRPQQALWWAQQAQSDSPDISLLQLQGQLLFSLKRYPDAVTLFGRIAKLEKGSGKAGAAWLMQGYAAWNGELWGQARKAFKQAKRYPDQRKRATQLLQQLREVSPSL